MAFGTAPLVMMRTERLGQAQEAFVRNLSFIRLLVALFGHIFVISLRFSNSFYCGKVKGALCAEHL